jgi:hypothetical protein
MRRAFGRPLRSGFAGNIPPLLQHANQLMSTGNYTEAASAFEQLGRAAEARGGPRAPFFYIQAGRAHIQGRQIAPGLEYLQRGLGLFAVRGQAGKVFNVGNRIVGELNQHELTREAGQISSYIKSLIPNFNGNLAGPAQAKRPPLPTHCPGCGAPVRPDEVEWLDDATAECAFCGSPVRGES